MPTKKDAVDGAPVHIQYGNFREVHKQTISTKTSAGYFRCNYSNTSFLCFSAFPEMHRSFAGDALNSRPTLTLQLQELRMTLI